MNFDFSDDQKLIQEQARRLLSERFSLREVRRVLDGEISHDDTLWRAIAELGFLGIAIPEAYGGLGLGRDTLCLVAQELGRALATVPVASTLYLGAEALLAGDDEALRLELLPRIATGDLLIAAALAEGSRAASDASGIAARLDGDRLTGVKLPVADAGIADFAIVSARDSAGQVRLVLAPLDHGAVSRQPVETIDPSRPHHIVRFDGVPVRMIAQGGEDALRRLLDRAAIYIAFEQLGGAEAALAMACDYARLRHAFGRPIGSFQAIKHKLADMYVNIELARGNCTYGAWAMAADTDMLPLAAATARISATEAFDYAARENIQVHGGIGATWEADMHLFYRRARLLALTLGNQLVWRERAVGQLERRAA